MARDAIPIVVGAINGFIDQGAGVAINVTNGANLAAVGVTDNLVLIVDHTTVSAKNLTVKAGVYPPAFRSGMGDLVLALTASKTLLIFIESARFVQADGSINIDFEAATTGTVYCVRIPPESL